MEFFCIHEQKRTFQEHPIFEVTHVVLIPLSDIPRDCLIPQLQDQPMEKEPGMS